MTILPIKLDRLTTAPIVGNGYISTSYKIHHLSTLTHISSSLHTHFFISLAPPHTHISASNIHKQHSHANFQHSHADFKHYDGGYIKLNSQHKWGIIKFKNRRCHCGVKVVVKIFDSHNNLRKLYFVCERGK